jgi:VanZ family protein
VSLRSIRAVFVSAKPWIPVILVATTIWFASGRPRAGGPDVPGLDKVAHALVFGFLATLLRRTPELSLKSWVWAALAASAYGALDETHQAYVPGRGFEWADMAADTAGAFLAVGLYVHWPAYRRLLETPLLRRTRASGVSKGDATRP